MSDKIGQAYIEVKVDTSDVEKASARIEAGTSKIGQSAKQAMDAASNAAKSGVDAMKKAMTDATAHGQSEAGKLEKLYKRVFEEMGSNTLAELKETINVQKNSLNELKAKAQDVQSQLSKMFNTPQKKSLQKDLDNVKREIQESEVALKAMNARYSEMTSQTLESFRTKILRLTKELTAMRIEGSQNTEEYKKMEAELNKYATALREVNQSKQLGSTGGGQFVGIINGLQGLMGAYTAASGVISMFISDQEQLMKIQTKMQSLMSILMGLQSVMNTLHSTSSFRLQTVAKAQELYAKMVARTNVALAAGSKAAKAFQLALTKTGIGAILVVIGTLIAGIASLISKMREGNEVQKAYFEAAKAGGEAMAKAKTEIDDYKRKLESTNLSHQKEKKLISELNNKYGDTLGRYKTKAEWLDTLNTKTEAYIQTLYQQKMAEMLVAKAVEEAGKQAEIKAKFNEKSSSTLKMIWNAFELHSLAGDMKDSKKRQEQYMSMAKDAMKKAGDMQQQNELGLWAPDSEDAEKVKEAYESLKDAQEAGLRSINKSRTALMAEGIAKVRSEADDMVKEQTAALEKEKKAREKARQEQGESGLTKEDKNEFEQRANYIKAEAAKKVSDAYKKMNEDIDKANKSSMQAITDGAIEAMEEGLNKELAQIENERKKKLKAIDEEEKELAKKYKQAGQEVPSEVKDSFTIRRTQVNTIASNKTSKTEEENAKYIQELYKQNTDVFLTEEQKKVNAINERYDLQRKQLAKDLKGGTVSQDDYSKLSTDIDNAQAKETTDYWLSVYGNYYQQREALTKEWEERLAIIPAEYAEQAKQKMQEALTQLDISNFKANIDWDSVFGNLSEQSSAAIATNLERVKAFFEANKDSMSIDGIKDMQEAISQMSTELDNRNPLGGLISSLKEISNLKDSAITALNELKQAQEELVQAQQEYNDAKAAKDELDAQAEENPEIVNTETYIDATTRLTDAKTTLGAAEDNVVKKENNALNTVSKTANAYTRLSSNLNKVGSTIGKLGTDAKNFAAIFSDDVADSIGKAVNLVTECISAVSSVINTMGNTANKVVKDIGNVADGVSSGVKDTSKTASESIKSVERASVILAIISAALQVATAIAGMFGDNKMHEEEIARLQERIDQLQWELEHVDTVRLENATGKALDRVKNAYLAAIAVAQRLTWEQSKHNNSTFKLFKNFVNITEKERAILKVSKDLAAVYESMSYSVGKALGADKYNDARKIIENYTEQMTRMYSAIEEEKEKRKKKRDDKKITEWEQKIAELGQKAKDVLDELVEDIVGGSATEIADELGNAFLDAFEQGENAAQAWGDKVSDIVKKITRQMLIEQLLQKPMGEIFDKYKERWFGTDGRFRGFDSVIGSLTGLATDLNELGASFSEAFGTLPQEVRDMLLGTASREAVAKGIATASQESVDENNGRLTAIQGHTYQIVADTSAMREQQAILVNNSANILRSVMAIEGHTERIASRMDSVEAGLTEVRNTVSDISLRGVRIR